MQNPISVKLKPAASLPLKFIVIAGLKILLSAVERRATNEYVSAAALIANTAFAYVEFSEQLVVVPGLSPVVLEDFSNSIMARIKTMVFCSKNAMTNNMHVFNSLPELKAAALDLAREIKAFMELVSANTEGWDRP